MTETRGSGNIAQGSANILSGLFGGMGGCAMIGQSIISGGRGRLSGLVASISLLWLSQKPLLLLWVVLCLWLLFEPIFA